MKLPRFLRDSSLLELLTTVDGDFERQRRSGSFTIQVHYKDGKPDNHHIDAPIVLKHKGDLTEAEAEA